MPGYAAAIKTSFGGSSADKNLNPVVNLVSIPRPSASVSVHSKIPSKPLGGCMLSWTATSPTRRADGLWRGSQRPWKSILRSSSEPLLRRRNSSLSIGGKPQEERRIAQDQEEAEWRAAFQPHAVIWTERTVPTQITICGLTGGAERWLVIRFDLSKPPLTFIQQALEALRTRVNPGGNVSFFGRALGFIVNYSPDQAVRCDLIGRPLEVLARAYRPGEVTLSFGGKAVSPTVMSRILSPA
jgi:hypothetical protein